MQIQVSTDHHLSGSAALSGWIEAEMTAVLDRFSDRVTRVKVHLSDVNSHKGGYGDKRCLLEARLAGLRPVAVSHRAGALDRAVEGAADKLGRSLAHTIARTSVRKGGRSAAGDPSHWLEPESGFAASG